MEGIDDIITDAKDCVYINLVRPSSTPDTAERVLDEPIQPEFADYVFGDGDQGGEAPPEQPQIIGYKNLVIALDFRANDLQPRVNINYKQKVDLSKLLGAELGKQLASKQEIEPKLRQLLPESAFEANAFSHTIGPDPTSKEWKPPGERIESFEWQGKQFEIWSACLDDPVALALWKNMQILVLFFVDGASALDLSEPMTFERWTLHVLYEVTPLKDTSVSPYTIAGFSTSYRFWIFPTAEVKRATKSLPSPPASSNGDATDDRLEKAEDAGSRLFKDPYDPLFQAPSRERISQFLILPPYQGQLLGARLYDTICAHYRKMPHIYEIPVEDPNMAFDAMRDLCDIIYLRTLPAFEKLSVVSSLPQEKLRKKAEVPRELILGNGADLTALCHEAKMPRRQFNRMVELHVLSKIPPTHRNRARLTRKDKASNEYDRQYYFWRLAVKARIYKQNEDVLDQMKDEPELRNEQLEKSVDSQEEEYDERLEALERREDLASGAAEGASDEEEEDGTSNADIVVTSRSRKRARVVEEDEDDDSEDDDESVSSKRPKI